MFYDLEDGTYRTYPDGDEATGRVIRREIENRDTTISKLEKEKQELTEYLKEKIKEQEHKSKFLDFGLDIIHNKVKIMTYKEILSKIEKR